MSFVVIVDNRFYYLLKFISLRSRPSFDRRFYEKSETGKEGTLWGVALTVPLFSLKFNNLRWAVEQGIRFLNNFPVVSPELI